MSALLQRRLPGVRFDVPAPALDETLPRMDIALFVGFTACGPLDVPVAVESLAEFEDVFGGEVFLLARPDGSPQRGLLHPALRQFFSHGGQRAWVLRVAAAHARTTIFPLQQMLLLRRPAADAAWRVEPAWVAARSPGAWADSLSVFARCDAQPLAVAPAPEAFDGRTLVLTASGPLALALGVGDVLRIALDADDVVQGRVAELGSASADADGRLQRALRLDRLASLRLDTRGATPTRVSWTVPVLRGDGTAEQQAAATGHWLPPQAGLPARLVLSSRLPSQARLQPGELVRVSFVGGRSAAWMALDEVLATASADGELAVQLTGRPWRVPAALRQVPLAAWVARAATTTALWLRAGVGAAFPAATEARLDGLALVPRADGAPSLFSLPDDVRHYTERARQTVAARAAMAFELAPRNARPLAGPRFALASLPLDGGADGEAMLLPLAVGPGLATGLGARNLGLPALRRDGLDKFDWRLFAEPALAGLHADALADQAEALHLLGRTPRALRGLHAVFGSSVDGPAEEPTLLVVPDAVQPGWVRKRRSTPPRRIHPQPPAPLAPDSGGFSDCALTPLAAPQFQPDADPDAAGNFMLRWTQPEPGLQFELQEAADKGFSVASVAYGGADTQLAIIGKGRSTQFYRVRASAGQRISPWSDILEVRTGASDYELRPWNSANLLALHRLMLRAAAGRGDMLALLGLPEHYRWPDAIAHAQALRAGTPDLEDALAPPPMGEDEVRALSHGALNHPWVLTRRIDAVLACPPDGAIAGQMAASALARGAWIAVANQPLKDVVALGLPASLEERQALLEAQVNALLASPAGFVAGSSETLRLDADWRPVNVRRLMSLLRRAALKRGATYVFEPNGDTLRRTVERAFEALLETLLRRGAFAGRDASQAYRVVVGDEINPPAQRDAGQLHIDLKVAPALPLTFLTVRLARDGERLSARELR